MYFRITRSKSLFDGQAKRSETPLKITQKMRKTITLSTYFGKISMKTCYFLDFKVLLERIAHFLHVNFSPFRVVSKFFKQNFISFHEPCKNVLYSAGRRRNRRLFCSKTVAKRDSKTRRTFGLLNIKLHYKRRAIHTVVFK